MGERPAIRVAVIGNSEFSMTVFRLSLLRALRATGAEVHCLYPGVTPLGRSRLEAEGLRVHEISIGRGRGGVVSELRDLLRLVVILRRIAPTHQLAYFTKPVIFATFAGLLAGVRHRFALIEGGGYALGDESVAALTLQQRCIRLLLGVAVRRTSVTFVLNSSDEALLQRLASRGATQIVRLPGIGVSLSDFVPGPTPAGPTSFALIARLLGEKGVRQYAEAAGRLRRSHPEVRCILLGGVDDHPDAVPREEVERWVADGWVEWHGHVSDVRPTLRKISALVLPTYYAEGMPRSIIEAMAMGRAVITTAAPGCRDVVEDGRTGILVEMRSVDSLYAAMLRLAESPGLAAELGVRARQYAEQHFDENQINAQVLRLLLPRA